MKGENIMFKTLMKYAAILSFAVFSFGSMGYAQGLPCQPVSFFLKKAGVAPKDFVMQGFAEGYYYNYYKRKNNTYLFILLDESKKCAYDMKIISSKEFLEDKNRLTDGDYDGEDSPNYKG